MTFTAPNFTDCSQQEIQNVLSGIPLQETSIQFHQGIMFSFSEPPVDNGDYNEARWKTIFSTIPTHIRHINLYHCSTNSRALFSALQAIPPTVTSVFLGANELDTADNLKRIIQSLATHTVHLGLPYNNLSGEPLNRVIDGHQEGIVQELDLSRNAQDLRKTHQFLWVLRKSCKKNSANFNQFAFFGHTHREHLASSATEAIDGIKDSDFLRQPIIA